MAAAAAEKGGRSRRLWQRPQLYYAEGVPEYERGRMQSRWEIKGKLWNKVITPEMWVPVAAVWWCRSDQPRLYNLQPLRHARFVFTQQPGPAPSSSSSSSSSSPLGGGGGGGVGSAVAPIWNAYNSSGEMNAGDRAGKGEYSEIITGDTRDCERGSVKRWAAR